MQFQRPDEIVWPELVESDSVMLLVCAQVVSELDKLKVSNDARKQKRAKAIIKWLKRQDDSPVRSKVNLEFLVVEPSKFQDHQLDPTVPDDRILASMLEFKNKNPSSDVRLCAADFGIGLKAKHRGLQVLELPEKYELPAPDNSREKDLEREISRLRNQRREPQLAVRSGDGKDRIEVSLPLVKQWANEQIQAELAKERDAILEDEETQTYIIGEAEDAEDGTSIGMEKLVRAYLGRLQEHLEQAASIASEHVRTLKIDLVLENSGTAPASKIDVRFSAPDWVTLKGEVELLDFPERPKWNWRDEMARPIVERVLPNFPNFDVLASITSHQIDGFFEDDSSWYSLRLQHGSEESIQFYAIIDAEHDVQGFQLGFEIHADEHPTPSSGTIHVIPKASGQKDDPTG